MDAATVASLRHHVGPSQVPADDPLLDVLGRQVERKLAARSLAQRQTARAVDLRRLLEELVLADLGRLKHDPHAATQILLAEALPDGVRRSTRLE